MKADPHTHPTAASFQETVDWSDASSEGKLIPCSVFQAWLMVKYVILWIFFFNIIHTGIAEAKRL